MSEVVVAERVSPVTNANTKVFVIEDHNLVREGLLALLRSDDSIEVVGDSHSVEGAEALIANANPDVVVTDIGMDECVFSMIRDLRKTNPKLRFIAVTAFDTDLNISSALQLGVHGFLKKTDSSDELLDAIVQVSAGNTVYSDSIRSRIEQLRNHLEVGSSTMGKPLSLREVEVLRLVAQGLSAKEVAKNLQISVKTVDRHKSNIMQKLNMHNQVELTRYAIRGGLVNV